MALSNLLMMLTNSITHILLAMSSSNPFWSQKYYVFIPFLGYIIFIFNFISLDLTIESWFPINLGTIHNEVSCCTIVMHFHILP